MKGSKKLGKSILVIALSLILIVSAIAPMTVMGSENNGGGSKGTSLGQYRYYSVKSGDTMESIAQKNGITISDIMTYNGLDADDSLYRGQVLKLPLTTSNTASSIVSSRISIKAKDSNVKDLVSAIAYNAGYTVIFKGSGDEKVTLDLENVSPLKAIDYVTRMVNLSYLKDGNTLLVSTPNDLNSTFVDSLVLTKFSFKYITSDELLGQASALGLGDTKVVSQTNNKRDVWISAYPKEMAKLAELVEILDASENISVGSNSIAAAFSPIELKYIAASEFSNLLGNLGLHSGITMSSRPQTLFVYVSGTQLADIMTIKKVVDTPDAIRDSSLGGGSNGTGGGTPVINESTTAPGTTEPGTTNPGTTTPGTTEPTPETPEEPMTYEKIDLVNISRADAETIISRYVQNISTYGHEKMTKSLWLFGTATAIANAKAIISDIDANVASAASTVHTYTAQHCTVNELMNRLANVKYEGVQFYTYDHSEITNSLIVYCDDVTWNNEIYDLLVALDTVDTGEKMWLPVDSITNNTSAKAISAVQDRFSLMQTLYPETFGGAEVKYVSLFNNNDSSPEYKGIAYVKTTSDQATRMKNLFAALDNA